MLPARCTRVVATTLGFFQSAPISTTSVHARQDPARRNRLSAAHRAVGRRSAVVNVRSVPARNISHLPKQHDTHLIAGPKVSMRRGSFHISVVIALSLAGVEHRSH